MDVQFDAAASPACRRLADLPGPPFWPLVGNLLQLDLDRFHQQVETWAERYGPLYRFRIGPRDVLVVARPDLITTLLRDRPEGWSRLRSMQAVIYEMEIDGVFAAEGEAWRRQRRLVAAAFTPGHLARYFPLVARITERLLARLHEAARAGEAVDLQATLMRYSVDVTASLAFGIDVNTMQQSHDVLQSHLDTVFPTLMRRIMAPFPLWRYVKLPADRAFDRHLAAGHQAVAAFVQSTRERMRHDPSLAERPNNLLEAMLAARDEDGAVLAESEVAGNVFTMLLAGEDTTANTLAWSLYLLHTHPEAWRAVVAEVDAALGADAVPPSMEAANRLMSIEHCSNESMRLRPVAPLNYLENNRPTEFGGLALPAGTFVICAMRSGAVDVRVKPDAAEFRPDRWRDPVAADRTLTAASMPFGGGPRICPGRFLAMLEMKMVVATIARNFTLLEVGTADGAPPRERMAFAMSPVGLRMKLAPRADPPAL